MFIRRSRDLGSLPLLVLVILVGCGSAQVGGGDGSGEQTQATKAEASPLEYYNYYMSEAGLAVAEGDTASALDFYLSAAQALAETGEVTVKEADAHYEAAGMAYQRADPEQAVAEYDKAIQIYVRFSGNSKMKAAVALNNMGVVYKEMAEPNKARNCWDEALQIHRDAPAEFKSDTNRAKVEQNLRDLAEGF